MFSGIELVAGRKQRSRKLRNFQRALLVSSAALTFTPVSSFAQNLILNPGFETNNLSNWTTTGSVDVWPNGGYGENIPSASGNFFANPFNSGGTLSQTVGITQSGKYNFSFFYDAASGQTWNLTAIIGTTTVFNGTVTNTNSMLQSTSTVVLSTGTTTALFNAVFVSGGFGEFGIDDVSLTYLGPNLLKALLPSNAPINPTNVAAAIDAFTTAGGTPPGGFQNLYNLTPQQLGAALTQVSGETATASQQTTFDAMTQFMGLLTDPFMGRNGTSNPMPGATGYADEASAYAATKKADAFAMFTKAPPGAPFEQRWSMWAAGFGGSQTTDGNAAVGSNNTTSSIAGIAVGADYLFSPNTIAGFALAGGGTNFSVANNLGSGRSDLFQAGAYLRHTNGPAYVSAALAYGWQDITTNRTVTVAGFDQLRAEFNANAWSGRLEGGYRFVSPATIGIGITPYAAAQFVTFDLPAYAEQAIVGTSNFALAYGAKSVTDTRSELGLRTDKSYAMADGIFTLGGRVAWAHDFNPDRSIGATFQTLPGASFVVNGAAQASDSALVTASVEKKWLNGWSAAATFEGGFSQVTTSYAGKGVVRYTW
jgi:uncharacterized protein with beta-barrel porin domain